MNKTKFNKLRHFYEFKTLLISDKHKSMDIRVKTDFGLHHRLNNSFINFYINYMTDMGEVDIILIIVMQIIISP